ncbi:SusD/RagB family nutrient-binding outer membrane lipoprotein [Ferruginibacter sp. SUN106]|uniref:SusD/RagB family nutrient-binding outer membrane lipoprotein n=1 Tax=Ferruginibacter sp. SUN106 TaxID=2978348 RepID=UPI003D36D389
MKNTHIKIALFSMGLTTLVSCNKIKDFGDTNTNPTAITTPATYAILTNVESGISGWAKDGAASAWIQYSSETQYPSEGIYDVTTTYFGFGTYSGTLLNLKTIIDKNNNPDEVAAARVLTQYVYWHLTDALGDIPYSQAFASKTPAYDKQEDIYKGMIKELKAAKAQFANTGGLKGDILNGGDVNKWIKFANSLRAMMAIQLTKRYPGATDYAATEFKAALADGVIDNNTDNIKLVFPGGSFKNPYWSDYDGARDNGESTTIYAMLANLGDNRHAAFGTSAKPVPFGLKEASINDWIKNNVGWSHLMADNQRLETSPVYMLTASQLYVARAEAAVRGWTSENKTAMLVAGVNASFAQWGLALPPASYFTQSGVVLDGTNDIKKVAEQAFLAGFPNGRAGWNVWRRTGYPVLTNAPDPLNAAHTTIPRRYIYTPATASTFSEYSLNAANVNAAVAKLVPAADQPESKIWWDQ